MRIHSWFPQERCPVVRRRSLFSRCATMLFLFAATPGPAHAQWFAEPGGGVATFERTETADLRREAIQAHVGVGHRFGPMIAVTGSGRAAHHQPAPSTENIFETFWTFDYTGGLRLYPLGGGAISSEVFIEAGAGGTTAYFKYTPEFLDQELVDNASETVTGRVLYAEVGYRWPIGGPVWLSPAARYSRVRWQHAEDDEQHVSLEIRLAFGR